MENWKETPSTTNYGADIFWLISFFTSSNLQGIDKSYKFTIKFKFNSKTKSFRILCKMYSG